MLTFAALLLCSCVSLVAQVGLQGNLLVLSKTSPTLTIVDTATLQIIATITTGAGPRQVVAPGCSGDGRTAYVARGVAGGPSAIEAVDLAQRKSLGAIDLAPPGAPGGGQYGIACADGHLWFIHQATNSIDRYDPVTQRANQVFRFPQKIGPVLYVAPGGRRILTIDPALGVISRIDLQPDPRLPPLHVLQAISGGTVQHPSLPQPVPPAPAREPRPISSWKQTVLPAGPRMNSPAAFDVSPQGNQIWAASALDGTISILDLASGKLIATVPTGLSSVSSLRFTPDGTRVLASSLHQLSLIILDARSRTILGRVPVGRGASSIVVQPDGTRAYVACPADGYVALVDLSTLRVIRRIQAGKPPTIWLSSSPPLLSSFHSEAKDSAACTRDISRPSRFMRSQSRPEQKAFTKRTNSVTFIQITEF